MGLMYGGLMYGLTCGLICSPSAASPDRPRAGTEAYLWPGISPAVRTYFAEIALMIKAAGQIAARIYPNGVSRGT
jgi:hypothetical protein